MTLYLFRVEVHLMYIGGQPLLVSPTLVHAVPPVPGDAPRPLGLGRGVELVGTASEFRPIHQNRYAALPLRHLPTQH